jgi:hypothetical protein
MPDLSWLDKLRGKRTQDIDLPAESGQVDPALIDQLHLMQDPHADAKIATMKKQAFDASNRAVLQGLTNAAQVP